MARPCSTCNHPDRAAIEIGLANGIACRVLGKRYGLDPSQLSRHRTKHMTPELLTKLAVRPNRSDEELAHIREVESRSLLDNLVWQRSRMYANADRCTRIGDEAGERAAMAEAGRCTERIAKLLGELGAAIRHEHRHVHIASMPEYHAVRTELVRALRPFPEAHQAAIAAFHRAEALAAQASTVLEGEAQRVRQQVESRATEMVPRV